MTSPAEPRTLTMLLGQGGLMAVTVDPDGDNLPRPQDHWPKVGSIENSDEIVYAAVAAKGYMFMQRVDELEDGPDPTETPQRPVH